MYVVRVEVHARATLPTDALGLQCQTKKTCLKEDVLA
jgi:hypothetical protein